MNNLDSTGKDNINLQQLAGSAGKKREVEAIKVLFFRIMSCYCAFYETSRNFTTPFYNITNGLVAQSLLANLVCDWYGKLEIAKCNVWKDTEFVLDGTTFVLKKGEQVRCSRRCRDEKPLCRDDKGAFAFENER